MPILRIKAQKSGRLRFLSHLETQNMLERSMKRADVPLKYSNGFNPHPNISFAAPLPVGSLSEYEIIDIDVIDEFEINQLLKDQIDFFPKDFYLMEGYFIENDDSLMSQVAAGDYLIKINENMDGNLIKESIDNFLSKDEVLILKRTKKGKRKEVDIRSQVKVLKYLDEEKLIFMKLDAGSVSNLKPLVLMDQIIKIPHEKMDVIRTKLYKEKEGLLIELF
ncbi:MAG: DUF2344 domain-containing protein [Clostridiales bacterium]|nr:DUF2344 domain-containing protein [Clostridiales bacterium]